MSLFEFLYIGHAIGNNRRGLRLPLLLGRLHLGLIFSGPSSCSSGRKSTSDKCSLRSFLFIATIIITKCGSSAFPNRSSGIVIMKTVGNNQILGTEPTPSSATSANPFQEDMTHYMLLPKQSRNPSNGQLLEDHQDFPMQHILTMHTKGDGHYMTGGGSTVNGHYIGDGGNQVENVRTLGYVLKGMILPMLISLTLSFGFVIYKNRVKRARLQAIQNALEQARTNPNLILHPRHPPVAGQGGMVRNAILSVIDARDEWSLISGDADGVRGQLLLEGDDYMGEGGETARFKPYLHDKPPDYASVVDPPTYEQATTQRAASSKTAGQGRIIVPSSSSVLEEDNEELLQLLPSIISAVLSDERRAGGRGDNDDEAVTGENREEREDEGGKLMESAAEP